MGHASFFCGINLACSPARLPSGPDESRGSLLNRTTASTLLDDKSQKPGHSGMFPRRLSTEHRLAMVFKLIPSALGRYNSTPSLLKGGGEERDLNIDKNINTVVYILSVKSIGDQAGTLSKVSALHGL
jgi:hypothetical protein